MRIIHYLKRKMTTINNTINYDNNHLGLISSIDSNFGTIAERSSCWCILFVDDVRIEARIIHNERGKFKIIEDKSKANYVNKVVDASDVICCRVKPSDIDKYERHAGAFKTKKSVITFKATTICHESL